MYANKAENLALIVVQAAKTTILQGQSVIDLFLKRNQHHYSKG